MKIHGQESLGANTPSKHSSSLAQRNLKPRGLGQTPEGSPAVSTSCGPLGPPAEGEASAHPTVHGWVLSWAWLASGHKAPSPFYPLSFPQIWMLRPLEVILGSTPAGAGRGHGGKERMTERVTTVGIWD
ncbi:unnamed protein product [Rangifer tarandus platyrhynchus]|uniref:Uncharacterized protein n=1 Tax=Rangifer tarandus platyrhynchus TaxID=3082113 RepID=A0ABN8ZX00_RANTA|nr:unnamed protein product [Rangifer tarandus platyrhynchus]